MSKSDQKDFFNQRAESWRNKPHINKETGRPANIPRQVKKLFSLIPLGRDDRVLDVGCGSGFLVPHILSRLGDRGRLLELDYAENMISVNRRLHRDRRVDFMIADVHELEEKTGSFDLIICFSCFPHFEDKQMAMRRMAAVLKPGGRLAVAHFLSSAELNDLHRGTPGVTQARMPDEEEMRRLFKESGLRVLSLQDCPGFYLALGGFSENPRAD
jgi:ubiquinone/menaquinone biosynthesis C-methylase UbiE